MVEAIRKAELRSAYYISAILAGEAATVELTLDRYMPKFAGPTTIY